MQHIIEPGVRRLPLFLLLFVLAAACDTGAEDPCASCDANATCQETPSGAVCACNLGFVGDGTSCEEGDEGSWGDDYVCECDEVMNCYDGVVHSGGPTSCRGCGEFEFYHCEHGCWFDSLESAWDARAQELCFEYYSHSVGDPCDNDEDCLPTEDAQWGGDGVEALDLVCDHGAGMCVERSSLPQP